jgi:hypothetical protein
MRLAGLSNAAAILGLSLIAGCAGYAPSISKDDKPTGKDAYLYGRFYMNAPEVRLALGGHQTMGFVVKCADQQSYTIRFERQEPLQVIRIVPSSCGVAELVYTDADGFVKSRKPAPAALQRDAAFEAGKAYYLGDFYAESTTSVEGRMIYRQWRITNVRDDYRATTEKLKLGFPNFSGLATENRMLGR